MKVAVIGSRNCGNLSIDKVVSEIPEETSAIISGGAAGVDSLAREAAKILNIPLTEFLPNYALFGKSAPLVRNSQIVNEADMVLAFWDYKSNGTRNALIKALKKNKKIKIVIIDEAEKAAAEQETLK